MKKVLRNFVAFVFCFVSLVSVTCFCGEKLVKTQEEAQVSSYYYETDSNYLKNLVSDGGTRISRYNLSDYYPIISENQTDSKFCWIYSSMKALETAFMVQTDEYYNFSEVAQAYLIYEDDIKTNSDTTFNYGANFGVFVQSYQDYGLILESDFSNTEYQAMNSNADTASYYSYVKNYATKKYNSYIKPYDVSSDNYYSKLDTESKRKVIKNFILNYGGVFAGIEGSKLNNKGCFYFDSSAVNPFTGIYNFYSYDRTPERYVTLNDNHAITLIGWNDDIVFNGETGAFLALNSWGFEPGAEVNGQYNLNSCEYFYIPYSYAFLYETIGGFIIDTTASQDVEIVSSSQSSFNEVLKNAKELDNYFCYDDQISITYKINGFDVSNLKIKFSNNDKSFDGYFSVFYNSEENQVKISLEEHLNVFYGGYYTISFYNGEELITKKSLYIFSGTETGSFKFMYNVNDSSSTWDTYALNNTFLSSNNTATIYIDGSKEYFFTFNYATINSYNKITSENCEKEYITPAIIMAEIASVSSTGVIELEYDDLFYENPNYSNYQNNAFFYQLGYKKTLSQFKNTMLTFRLTINSVIYQNCYREYVINMFVSELEGAKTSSLNLIRYELNGGENSDENITKYPSKLTLVDAGLETERYEKIDANMTSFTLKNPTRNGFDFVGWYLDSDFKGEAVTTINKLDGNIVLYARWIEKTGQVYFNVALTVDSIVDYNLQSKLGTIVYGDTIGLKINLIPNSESGIQSLSYRAIYRLSYGGKIISNDYLLGNSKIIYFGFPELKSGENNFKVSVEVSIGSFTVEYSTNITVTVNKKPVKFSFDNLSKVYNGAEQKPSVVMLEDFYDEDKIGDLYVLKCDKTVKGVGKYNFYIDKLLNSNYTFDSDARCEFEITPRTISVEWSGNAIESVAYNGKNHFPNYEPLGVCVGDNVQFKFNVSECKNVGTYNIKIVSTDNENYVVDASAVGDYKLTITPSHVKITLYDTTDRLQTKAGRRKTPVMVVTPNSGNYYNEEDLQAQITSQALYATKSGKYTITCTIGSPNYECEIVTATYTLTGYYYVYYQLTNGTTITERVEEGKSPKGVTKEDFDAPRFSKISYSEDYGNSGKDIYVSVTLKDYSGVVYSAIFVGVFLLVCLIYYFKKRESKVR